jgi:hypothetical protein
VLQEHKPHGRNARGRANVTLTKAGPRTAIGQSVSVAGRHPGSSTAVVVRPQPSWPAGLPGRECARAAGTSPLGEQHSGHDGGQDHPGPVTHVAGLCSVAPAGCSQCRTQSAPGGVTRPAIRHAPAALQPSPAVRHCLRNVASGVLAQRFAADSAADGEDVRGRVPQFPPSPQRHPARRRWGLLPPGWQRISPARSARNSFPPRAPSRFSAAS